jgi:GNAT superfamily N-acetyltransferase
MDQRAIEDLLRGRWGSTMVVAHRTRYEAATLPAIIAEGDQGEVSGLLTYTTDPHGLEVVTIDAVEEHRGIGTALLEAARQEAARHDAAGGRLWLVTTNDNVDALRFYQRRGFRITGVDAGAVDDARKIKPDIPLVGHYGIPIRDEITLRRW